jgi:hypothetical protein
MPEQVGPDGGPHGRVERRDAAIMPHPRPGANDGLAGCPADLEDAGDACRAHSIVLTRPDRESARPRAARRRGRLALLGAALVLGIGSCQLPKPVLPKLQTAAVENVSAGAAVLAPGRAERSRG